MSCIFCQIIAHEIPSTREYEDDHLIVIKDIHPQAPLHLLIIPKVHVEEFIHLPDTLRDHIFSTAKKIIQSRQITGYRLVNNGKGAAFIDHFHLHILGSVQKERSL